MTSRTRCNRTEARTTHQHRKASHRSCRTPFPLLTFSLTFRTLCTQICSLKGSLPSETVPQSTPAESCSRSKARCSCPCRSRSQRSLRIPLSPFRCWRISVCLFRGSWKRDFTGLGRWLSPSKTSSPWSTRCSSHSYRSTVAAEFNSSCNMGWWWMSCCIF